jgi:hypothetical protein
MADTLKFQVGDRVRVNSKAPVDYVDRVGTVTELGPGELEYRVEFEDGQMPTTGYLSGTCLERARA